MKKTLAVLLIAVLMLGTCFSVATASMTLVAGLSSSDDESGEQENLEEEAKRAIEEAEEMIQKASNKIEEVSETVDVTDAKSLLDEANEKLSQAEAAYNADPADYEGAKQFAEEAEDLAEEAINLIQGLLEELGESGPSGDQEEPEVEENGEEKDEEENEGVEEQEKEDEVDDEDEEEDEELEIEDQEEGAEDAMEAIREAEEMIEKADEKIQEAVDNGLDVEKIEGLLDSARDKLLEAQTAYGDGDYEVAEDLAEEAKELAEEAKDLVEELLEKLREIEHADEEEDDEEDEELEMEEVEEGNLQVASEDNIIEFKKDEPKLEFEYFAEGTEIRFEAKDFALVEFCNSDIKRWLKFDEIDWDVTFDKTDEGDVTVTYYASSDEDGYEITLVMHVYQRSTIGSSTTQEGTVVFDVDGGGDEVKFDLIVSRWTWDSDSNADSSKLALYMKVETEAEGQIALESAGVSEDKIAINLDDIEIKIAWVTEAEIVSDGIKESVDVNVDYRSGEIKFDEEEVGLELEVYFKYPYFGENELVHDPSIGIEDDPVLYVFTLITPELLIGTGITAIAIVAAAIALTRRRKLSLLERTALSL